MTHRRFHRSVNRPVVRSLLVMLSAALLMGVALTMPRSMARAASIVVNSSADVVANNSECTLREAIINANNEDQSGSTDCGAGSGTDTITFDADYTITLGSQLPSVTSALVIDGNAPANTIIEANAAYNTATYRVFEVGGSGSLTLSDLTVRHGRCTTGGCATEGFHGGGIYNAGTLTLNSATVSLNVAANGNGGGVFSTGTLIVNASTVSGNYANTGGGITLNGGTGSVQNGSVIGGAGAGNSAVGGGGGIYLSWNSLSALTVDASTISANSAPYGGGISADVGNTLIIQNGSVIGGVGAGNIVSIEGGGLYIYGSSATMTNSTVSHNTAGGNGGGANIASSSTLSVTNSTFSNNAAGGGSTGGGIYLTSPATVTGSTISYNTAGNGAGVGIDPPSGSLTMTNSRLLGNTAVGSGDAIWNTRNAANAFNITSSCIAGNDTSAVFNTTASLQTATGNWWASATGPTHAGNPGGTGEAVSNNVDYTGFLTSPPAACPVPAVPSGLSVTAVSTSAINLQWTDNSSDESGFRIERSPDGTTGWMEIGSNIADDVTYSDNGLNCSTTYYYRVRAHRQIDNVYSGYSSVQNDTTDDCPPPTAPSGLSATVVSPTQVDLIWTDNSSDETSFRIERSPDGTTGWTEIGTNSADDITFSDTGLTCGTTYHYRVRAHRSGDDEYSDYSASVSPTPGCPPNPPSIIIASLISTTQIDLTFTDNSSDETSFRIERSPNGSTGWTEIVSNSANDTTYSDTGLTCGIYYYRARSHRSSDDQYSEYSNTAYEITLPCGIFADVPAPGKEFMQPWIETLYLTGITTGCNNSPLSYCPEQTVLRSSMAIFILRALNYPNLPYTPFGVEPDIFSDVPTPGKEFMEPWIEDFYLLGITGGCSQTPLMFCPENAVTRGAMAVFLLRAKYGSSYTPPPATGIFADQPTGDKAWMAPFVEQLYDEGITTGCGTSPLIYCPDSPVTRGAMAIFILRAFNHLPKP